MSTRLGRRGFMEAAAAFSAGMSANLWMAPPARAASAMGFDDARHLLARTSFGVTPAEIRALESIDYPVAVDRLLDSPRRVAISSAPAWVGRDRQNCAGGSGRPRRSASRLPTASSPMRCARCRSRGAN